MKSTHLFVLLSVLCLIPQVQAQERERVRLYTIAEFDAIGKEVPLSKPNLHLLDYLEKQLHIQFDLRRVPWKRAIENALNGDGILMGMSVTKEKSMKFAFSEPINGNGNWLVTLCDRRFKFEKLEDLKGQTIGIVSGTSVGEDFDGQANQLFRVEHDTGAGIARLQKLALKRVDGLIWYGGISNAKEIEETINHNFDIKKDRETPVFCVQSKPVSILTNHFAMKIDPNKNQILQRISAAILKGRKDGSLPTLMIPN
ncbi:transporter substrate-binding domain-containing protein [Undibacterium sp. LX40W]|uniref:Transporter substrate-binding domain-containing protein n=1 Tax=Undibacterium nitidum TaxID=2762298 RepID=A0A923KQU0_9BURK|nr:MULTISPECIES: transporter substrate-binding domain-containing protein [Undibacterium]MBC3883323.1 transporter substrate-binding domain-containing protein [Undibacterium nitidum]MBC3893605.1 transporter substrate-binding domain-containing protein [Undibacterium sp. LX40W]